MPLRSFRSARSCSRTAPDASRSAASLTSRGASRPPKPSCRAARELSPHNCSQARSRPTRMRSSCPWSSARSTRSWRKREVSVMRFDTPATTNPIDQLKVIGQPVDRIDGPLKTTGTAPYAYERHDVVADQAYGYVVGAAIAKGRITSIDLKDAKAAPGVLAIVTAENAGKLAKGEYNVAHLLGGPDIQHYHQAVGIVVAETFEQARAAAALVRVNYAPAK